MADDSPDKVCPLCDKIIDEGTGYTTKGNNVNNFVKASIKRQDKRYLKFKNRKNITVHLNCSKNYTQDAKIEALLRKVQKLKKSQSHEHATRSTRNVEFDFENLCFICGKDASDSFIDEQRKYCVDKRSIVRKVTGDGVKKAVLEKCYSFKSKFTIEVLSRIEHIEDLVERKARYHEQCQRTLYSFKVNPSDEPTDSEKVAHFIAKYIIDHKEDCQFSTKSILEHFDGDKSDVDFKYLKDHLLSMFGNDIIIHPSEDELIITYADACAKMLTENWYKNKKGVNEQDERDKVCSLAGRILFEDIRSEVYNTDSHPAPSNVVGNVKDDIPRSLRLILDEAILKNKSNPADFENVFTRISHIIIAAARPDGTDTNNYQKQVKRAKIA